MKHFERPSWCSGSVPISSSEENLHVSPDDLLVCLLVRLSRGR